jgi:hypothetical protein
MRTFLFLAIQRLAQLLVAVAFLAVPASAEAVCDPHLEHECAAYHQAEYANDTAGDHDSLSHEHEVHSHGTCHVSMTVPEPSTWSIVEGDSHVFRVIQDDHRRSGIAFPFERPPRV